MFNVVSSLQEYARRIAKVSIDAKLDLDEEEYVSKFKCTLMDVVLCWSKGATFLQICKMTDVFEGQSMSNVRICDLFLRCKNLYTRLTSMLNRYVNIIGKVTAVSHETGNVSKNVLSLSVAPFD